MSPPTRCAALLAAIFLLLAAGCQRGSPKAAPLRFWHSRTPPQEDELKAIVAEFNRTSGGPPIVPEYAGDYPQVR